MWLPLYLRSLDRMRWKVRSLKLVAVDSSAELISAADGSWSIEEGRENCMLSRRRSICCIVSFVHFVKS